MKIICAFTIIVAALMLTVVATNEAKARNVRIKVHSDGTVFFVVDNNLICTF